MSSSSSSSSSRGEMGRCKTVRWADEEGLEEKEEEKEEGVWEESAVEQDKRSGPDETGEGRT